MATTRERKPTPPPRRHRAKYKPKRRVGDEVTWRWAKPGVIAEGSGFILALVQPGDRALEVLAAAGHEPPVWDVRIPKFIRDTSYLVRMVMRWGNDGTPTRHLYYAIPCKVVDAGQVGPGVSAARSGVPVHRPPRLIGDGKRTDWRLPVEPTADGAQGGTDAG